jgi:hypothetical protein
MLAELSEKSREKIGFFENRIQAIAYDFRRMCPLFSSFPTSDGLSADVLLSFVAQATYPYT